jgi:hypothetical protein
MVCLELVQVTGCFLRDRDRQQAYPPPPSRPISPLGRTGKGQEFAVTTLSGPAGVGTIEATLRGGGIAPGEKWRNLKAVAEIRECPNRPARVPRAMLGPNVARFLVKPDGQYISA